MAAPFSTAASDATALFVRSDEKAADETGCAGDEVRHDVPPCVTWAATREWQRLSQRRRRMPRRFSQTPRGRAAAARSGPPDYTDASCDGWRKKGWLSIA